MPLSWFQFFAGSTWCTSWVRFSKSYSWPRLEENTLSQLLVFLLILFCLELLSLTFIGLTLKFLSTWLMDWVKRTCHLENLIIFQRTLILNSSTCMLSISAAYFGDLLSWFSSMLKSDHLSKLLRKCLETSWTSLFCTSFSSSCLPSLVELTLFLK